MLVMLYQNRVVLVELFIRHGMAPAGANTSLILSLKVMDNYRASAGLRWKKSFK
jgi:hypothetical protein